MMSQLRTYPLITTWSFLSSKSWMALLGVVQIIIPLGFVVGLSFLFPNVTPDIAQHLITGTATLVLLTMGMDVVPQMVATRRLQGTHEFLLSLPVPRMILLASDVTIFFLLTIPGIVIALVLGSVYHHFTLQVSPLVIPVFILISLTGSFVGYAVALGVPHPRMANVASQILLFFVVFFSPVIYSPQQLPTWLSAIHDVLPIKYMAELTQYSLSKAEVNVGLAFAVTSAWCVGSFLFCYYVMKKRA